MEEAIQWTGRSDGIGKHRRCLPRQGEPKQIQVRNAGGMCEELPGCPSKGKGSVVCVCMWEQKYRKSNTGGFVRVMLRRFFRLSFSRGASVDIQDTACSWIFFFFSCFQAKESVFRSYVNKLASWQQKHCKVTYANSPLSSAGNTAPTLFPGGEGKDTREPFCSCGFFMTVCTILRQRYMFWRPFGRHLDPSSAFVLPFCIVSVAVIAQSQPIRNSFELETGLWSLNMFQMT